MALGVDTKTERTIWLSHPNDILFVTGKIFPLPFAG